MALIKRPVLPNKLLLVTLSWVNLYAVTPWRLVPLWAEFA